MTTQTTLFYNTTNLAGNELKNSYESAKNQDGIILQLYQTYGKLSPSQVYDLLNAKYPITSIRRSINTITANGFTTQTEKFRIGMYGKKEHIWEIKP